MPYSMGLKFKIAAYYSLKYMHVQNKLFKTDISHCTQWDECLYECVFAINTLFVYRLMVAFNKIFKRNKQQQHRHQASRTVREKLTTAMFDFIPIHEVFTCKNDKNRIKMNNIFIAASVFCVYKGTEPSGIFTFFINIIVLLQFVYTLTMSESIFGNHLWYVWVCSVLWTKVCIMFRFILVRFILK